MLRTVTLVFLATVALACTSNKQKSEEKDVDSKPIPIVNFDGVKPLLNRSNDSLYVINFWATWCAPCVKEIPYFERLAEEFADRKLKVILINLDFSNHYESRLLPFVEKNGVKSKIVMLDDPDSNRWINQVDPSWSGAIPATLIYNKSERKFFEKEFTYEELKEAVNSFSF